MEQNYNTYQNKEQPIFYITILNEGCVNAVRSTVNQDMAHKYI